MGKHYCDYCDVFLTHDSPAVRRVHNGGHNHLANVRDYYANIDQAQAQEIIDGVAKDYDSRSIPRPAAIQGSTDVRMMGLNGPPQARGLTQVPITGEPIRLGIGEQGFVMGNPPNQPPPPPGPAVPTPGTGPTPVRPAGMPMGPSGAPDLTRPPPGFLGRPPPGMPAFNPNMPPPGFNPRVPPPGFNPNRPPPGFNPNLPPPPLNRPPPNFGPPPTTYQR